VTECDIGVTRTRDLVESFREDQPPPFSASLEAIPASGSAHETLVSWTCWFGTREQMSELLECQSLVQRVVLAMKSFAQATASRDIPDHVKPLGGFGMDRVPLFVDDDRRRPLVTATCSEQPWREL
jgi:hypothetical protein